MASIKSLLPAALLLIVGFAPHGAEAKDPGVMVMLTGIVPCSAGSSINMATVSKFPHASVQLVCTGRVVAGTTADSSGAFMIKLVPVTTTQLAPLLTNECKVEVTTPLAACNVSLAGATGKLTAPLQLVGAHGGGLGNDDLSGLIGLIGQIIGAILGGIVNIVPKAFSLV